MRSPARRARLVVAAGVLLLACAEETPVLDVRAAERAIEGYVRSTYPFVQVGEATCPLEVPQVQGGKFTCNVIVDGQSLRVEVTQEDDRGDRVSYVPVDAVLEMSGVVDDVLGQVAPSFTGEVVVDCGPDDVRVVAPGTTLECRGTDPLGTTRTIQVKVTDAAGTLQITVA